MIAENLLFNVLSMSRYQRHHWYKTILPEKKAEVMGIVETIRRVKRADIIISEETRAKLSASHTGRHTGEKNHFFGKTHTEETKAKMSAGRVGERNHNYGKPRTAETRAKISAAHRGKSLTEEHKANVSAATTKWWKEHPECKDKWSAATIEQWKDPEFKDKRSGENNPMWRGGTSFEPYCSAFNEQLKESIRNRDNRVCVLCGKSEIQNGRRLSVHHIDADKTQGCNGKNWYLCALCGSCNSRPDTVEKEFLIVTGGHGG